MKNIYIDQLSWSSLWSLIWLGAKGDQAFYFNSGRNLQSLLPLLVRLRLLRTLPKPLDFHMSRVNDKEERSLFYEILKDTNRVCGIIRGKELINNRLLKAFAHELDSHRLIIYFDKIIFNEVEAAITKIRVVDWHTGQTTSGQVKSAVFLIGRSPWFSYLHKYASGLDVEIRRGPSGRLNLYVQRLMRFQQGRAEKLRKLPGSLIRRFKHTSASKKKLTAHPEASANNKIKIAGFYAARTATFDRSKRSGIFWLFGSDIPYDQVMVYFMREHLPATPDMAEAIRAQGVSMSALSDKATESELVPVWRSSGEHKATKKRLSRSLMKAYFGGLMKMRWISPFYFAVLYKFIDEYSFWLDYLSLNNIKINIFSQDYDKAHVPMSMAINKLGGVHVSYQLSNIGLSSIALSTSADVVFSFGPSYERAWEANNSSIGSMIYSGYPTDYAFTEVRERSRNLRASLTDAGAKYIIAFFDENSSDGRMSYISNQMAADIYASFLRLSLEEESIGLIFKPKVPDTLHARLSSVSSLIDQAKGTGRCIFLDHDRDLMPCEATQAADLSVGLLVGGTTVLESFLAGTPAVFLDLKRNFANPIYDWGKGKVVFDNLDDLFATIRLFRTSPEKVSGFGDLSTWAEGRDPFRDGQASSRIGQYLNWLLERLEAGESREDAIGYANNCYGKAWGMANVVSFGSRSLDDHESQQHVRG